MQEAFVRLVSRWSRISKYDDPVAWVRRVAWNLAMSDWRRSRRAERLAVRLREETVPEPSALAAALREPRTEVGMRESDELVSAFAELEAHVRRHSRLPGLEAAQAEARRRRRRNRVAWMSSALAVVVAGGLLATVDGRLLSNHPPVLQPSTSVTADPSPSATVSPSPSVPTPATVLGVMSPPARIRDAALDVPAFDLNGCLSGRLQFAAAQVGPVDSGALVQVPSAAVGDVNSDGVEDIVAVLRCVVPSGFHGVASHQVVAYSGTGLTLLGRLTTAGDHTEVGSLLVRPDGDVELGVAEVGDVSDQISSITFHRYRWTGSGFTESTAPVTVNYDALPVLSVSATPASIRLAPGGPAQPIAVTIRNDGSDSSWPVMLSASRVVPVSPSVSISVAELGSQVYDSAVSLLITPPKAGESMTLTLMVAVPAGEAVGAGASIRGRIFGVRPPPSEAQQFTVTLLPA